MESSKFDTLPASDFGTLKELISFDMDIKNLNMTVSDFISRALGTEPVLVRFPSRLIGWYSYEFVLADDPNCYDLRVVKGKKMYRVVLSYDQKKKGDFS